MKRHWYALAFVSAIFLSSCGQESGAREDEAPRAEAPLSATISTQAATAAGIGVREAGPGSIIEVIELTGRVAFQSPARAEVRAPYSGPIRSVTHNFGDVVRRGEILARVESSESLQTYSVTAPLSGTLIERNANVGEVSGDRVLFVVADLSHLEAQLYVFPRDAPRIHQGQRVILTTSESEDRLEGAVASLVPASQDNMQAMIARVPINETSNRFRVGTGVQGMAVVAEVQAPLTVEATAIQRIGDDQVVFVQSGEIYSARAIQIGRRSREYVEVLSGINPGERYVARNAFVVKSQILGSSSSDEE